MPDKNNRSNTTLALKTTRFMADQLQTLADYNHITRSCLLKSILVDRINYEIAAGNPCFEVEQPRFELYVPKVSVPPVIPAPEQPETKPQAADLAPTAESLPEGRAISTARQDPPTSYL